VIYITDSEKNANHEWNISANKMNKLWENDDTDGADGLLDQPSEPIVVGKKS
jgi:hypothetical protein